MTTDYSSPAYLQKVDKYWRAANYLSVGQLYLKDNPLLQRPLKASDVKVHPIGHWGTMPSLYAHLNRVNKYGLKMFYVEGPGHGGQVMVSNSYLDGTYTDIYPEITQDVERDAKALQAILIPTSGGCLWHLTISQNDGGFNFFTISQFHFRNLG
uniref:hypothetical protein n=1 Tax=Lactiplantibacillus plantarum TaxID=1590 RepID=UPI0036F473E4